MNRVKVNQVYRAPMMGGKSLRCIRILAYHPDGGYLYEITYSYSGYGYSDKERFGVIKDLALEKAYILETDVCEHKHTEDVYIDGGSNYPPSVPNYYQCTDCGDLFPNTGDTDLWFPKQLEKVNV